MSEMSSFAQHIINTNQYVQNLHLACSGDMYTMDLSYVAFAKVRIKWFWLPVSAVRSFCEILAI